MSGDYIERDAIRRDVLGLTIMDGAVAAYCDAVLDRLNRAPAADVVPVVRCRECKYRENCDRQTTRFFEAPDFEATRCEYHELDFCSNGKKEEDNA